MAALIDILCRCGGALVVQRAAPGDAAFRIVCVSCGAAAVPAADELIEPVALVVPARS